MNLALARVGSVLNNYVSLAVAEHFHVSTALWVGVGVCLVSLISTIWCFYIDRTAELTSRPGMQGLACPPWKRKSSTSGPSRTSRYAHFLYLAHVLTRAPLR